jgi:hypothetical protein
MSYRKPNTGNRMNDYFSALVDFYMLAPNLLKAKNKQAFLIWFDKLNLIDRRSLFLYLREHRDEISEDYMKLAQWHFVREI